MHPDDKEFPFEDIDKEYLEEKEEREGQEVEKEEEIIWKDLSKTTTYDACEMFRRVGNMCRGMEKYLHASSPYYLLTEPDVHVIRNAVPAMIELLGDFVADPIDEHPG